MSQFRPIFLLLVYISSSLRSLFQGHVTCWNFTLTVPGWGGGYSTKLDTGRLSKVQLHTPYVPFSQKRHPFHILPFRIPSIDKWYPFLIPCLELCIPFNCCKRTVFYIGISHKNVTFSRHLKAIKFIFWPVWALRYRPK